MVPRVLSTYRSRQMPHLGEYLHHASSALRGPDSFGPGCAATALLSGLSFFFFVEFLGPVRGGMLALFVGLPILTVTVFKIARWMKQPKTPEEERNEAIRGVVVEMQQLLSRRRLRRSLDPAGAALLEECSRHWGRIHKELSSAYWTAKSLPAHWKSVRERALFASNAAMGDLLLMLRPVLINPQQGGLDGVLGEIVEAVFDQPPAPSGPLPPVFEPARQIGDKLKLLAAEVEAASKELATNQAVTSEYSSARALEATLGELRQIRQAEDELEEHLGQG